MTRPMGNILASVVFAAVTALYAGGAMAQQASGRSQTWEVWGETRVTFGKNIGFDHGSSVDTHDDAGFGLGFGYNIDEHWLVGFEFAYNELNYDASIASADVPPKANARASGTAQLTRFGGSLTYNFLARPLTPYVTGNLGYMYVDSNIPNGPPQTGCWWDPWYGYICSTWQSTVSSNAFEYGIGAGVQWDSERNFFLRFGYESDWVDISHASSTPGFSILRLQFGTHF
jgi:opacity protein-like surface antigen